MAAMEHRPLLAFLTNDLVGSYQYGFWAGIKSAAAKEDCDLVSFNGGAVASRDADTRMRNSCFDVVMAAKPDAVVILSSVFADAYDDLAVERFLGRFAPTPIVTVGFHVPGHPSILVDNHSGMRTLVEHLVSDHGRSRFCFLGSGWDNPDSRERRDAVVDVLSRHGLSLRAELDLEAGYDFGIARQRTKDLLDTGIDFDTVVAANDNMALGAMEALHDRGRRVPDDVVVTGFDNIEDGLWVPFGLTTVDQSVQDQGAAAIRIVLDMLESGAPVEEKCIASRPVLRGSCGCPSPSMQAARRGCPDSGPSAPAEGGLGSPGHLRAVLAECESVLPAKRFSPYLTDLLEAMASDCRTGSNATTLHRFQFLQEMAKTSDEGFDRWQILLSNLRGASLPFLPDDRRVFAAFESLLHQMRVAVHEHALQRMGMAALQIQRWAREVHDVGHRLTVCSEVEQVVELLASEAGNLKIASIHLLLREPAARTEIHRLHLSIQGGARARLPSSGLVQSPEEFFETQVRSRPFRSAMVMMPLFFGDTPLGYIFLELMSRRGMLLDALRGLISSAVIGTRLGESLSGGSAAGGDGPHPRR